MKRKKVLIHSNHCKAFTGFGKHTKNILIHLQKTGKYDIVSISGGVSENHPELSRTPWKSYGVVPTHGPEKRDYDSSPEKRRMYA